MSTTINQEYEKRLVGRYGSRVAGRYDCTLYMKEPSKTETRTFLLERLHEQDRQKKLEAQKKDPRNLNPFWIVEPLSFYFIKTKRPRGRPRTGRTKTASDQSRAWQLKNPEKFKQSKENWRLKNKAKIKIYAHKAYEKRKLKDPNFIAELAATAKAWRKANPEKWKASVKKWQQKHPRKTLTPEQKKQRKAAIKKYNKTMKIKHPAAYKKMVDRRKVRRKERLANDPVFRVKQEQKAKVFFEKVKQRDLERKGKNQQLKAKTKGAVA